MNDLKNISFSTFTSFVGYGVAKITDPITHLFHAAIGPQTSKMLKDTQPMQKKLVTQSTKGKQMIAEKSDRTLPPNQPKTIVEDVHKIRSAVETPNGKDFLKILADTAVSQGYDEQFVDLIEMIYGRGFLSQGGKRAIEQMVKGIQLHDRDVLDIGSGLGGPLLHLATTHRARMVGLEPQKWLYERALHHCKEVQDEILGSAQFVFMQDPTCLKPFNNAQFDVVMSKESILHIPLLFKKGFYREIHRVLKPGGEIVIMDWAHKSPQYSNNLRKMMELDGVAYHLMSVDEHRSMLEEAGFVEITMEEISEETANLSQGNIDKIREMEGQIKKKYGQDVYNYSIESWGYQRDAFASRELRAVIFKAKKEKKFEQDGS